MSKLQRDEIMVRFADGDYGQRTWEYAKGLPADIAPTAFNLPSVIKTVPIKFLAKNVGLKTAIKDVAGLFAQRATLGLVGGSFAPGIGNVIGLLLSTAITAYQIYDLIYSTHLERLIDAIGALDTKTWGDVFSFSGGDEDLQKAFDKWVEDLEGIQENLKPKTPPTTPAEKLSYLSNKAYTFKQYYEYLVKMDQLWKSDIEGYKSRVKDSGGEYGDIDDFEKALEAALNEAKTNSEGIDAAINSAYADVIKELDKVSNVDTSKICNEIISMYNEINSIYGKPVIFEGDEQRIFQLAQDIVSKKYGPEVEQYYPHLQSLHKAFSQAIQVARKKVKGTTQHAISKRALKLPSGERIKSNISIRDQERGTSSTQKTDTGAASSSSVKSLQAHLNYINATKQLGFARLVEDGIYGPKTAEVLTAIMAKDPNNSGKAIINSTGLSLDEFKDIQFMKSKPQAFTDVASILGSIVGAIKSDGGSAEKSVTPEDPSASKDTRDTLNFIKNRDVVSYGERMSAYDYLDTMGYKSDNQKLDILNRVFKNLPMSSWSVQELVTYAEREKRHSFS